MILINNDTMVRTLLGEGVMESAASMLEIYKTRPGRCGGPKKRCKKPQGAVPDHCWLQEEIPGAGLAEGMLGSQKTRKSAGFR